MTRIALTARLATAVTVVMSLWGGGSVRAQDQELQPQTQRIGHRAIRADHATYEAVQGRIKGLNDRGIQVDDYHLAKAQCWLDTSFHEYTRNDRGGYPQAALDESIKIIGALEAGQKPDWETPLVNDAQKLREDLWARYEALKTAPGFECAAKVAACGEVELVHAGNEIHDGGWRHARPYIQIAEDRISEAEAAAAACTTPAAAPMERFDLAADALFAFDRGDLAGLKSQGKAKLDELAARLKDVYVSVEHISLTGHTDRLGSEAYNQRLSQQRAQTVKAYLQQHGVTALIEAQGHGEREPVTSSCVGERATPALTLCLQPDRRVSVEISGTKHSPLNSPAAPH